MCGGTCRFDLDYDRICDDVDDCIGIIDDCGVCNGGGSNNKACGCADMPAGDCDCFGNKDDAIGVCGGACAFDNDNDGVCDDVDWCVGVMDKCGICQGPGAIYECGCEEKPASDCDCNGNAIVD